MKASSIGLSLVTICHALSAAAHHGNTEFDLRVLVRYEGTVVEQRWMNPHGVMKLATRSQSGEPITLEIEIAPPAVLRTGGVTAQSIVEGDKVTAVVSPSRRFPNQTAYGHEVVKSDGTVIPLTGPGLRRPQISESAQSIFGTWVPPAEFFGEMRNWALTWALTEKGNEVREDWSPLTTRQAQCVPMSAPMLMAYPVAIEFSRSNEHVVIRSDWMGAERTVYLDGRNHPVPEQRFPQGHSVGHWEGEVLVVETANFADEVWATLPSGRGKRLIERFAVGDDGKSMRYSFVLDDPEYLAQPVNGNGELSYRPDLSVGGMECDRDSASRFFREFQ
jgi:Family of unknown function (DUF6152)